MKNSEFHFENVDFRAVNWQEELKQNITNPDELQKVISLTEEEAEKLTAARDPIGKLAIPTADELICAGSMGETTPDPYGDDKHNKGNGVLHKYPYSALIVATEYCAMYCRHCFRKRLVGLPNDKTVENFQKAAQYIREHKEITNVIISGGDPLMLPTSTLQAMLESLIDIDHINYVRIGTRSPVVLPMRLFDEKLLTVFREFNHKKTLYIPTHFNHANEITPLAIEAVARIRDAGVTVNNQAVLLKGVNDSVHDVVSLMNGLVRIGVNPYYLYQCMPVSRVRHHFQVPLLDGVDIVSKAKQELDGYAKRFKFILGDEIGKIEICGRLNDKLVMSQIHAREKYKADASRILIRKLTKNAGWLDDLTEVEI